MQETFGGEFISDVVKLRTNDHLRQIFGDQLSDDLIHMINEIVFRASKMRYTFIKDEVWLEISSDKENFWQCHWIMWWEIVQRCHLTSLQSLYRTIFWANSMSNELQANNILGWCASCRGLLEATGDTLDTMKVVPPTIADNWRRIRSVLIDKKPRQTLFIDGFEESLEHFAKGRYLSKEQKIHLPKSHAAKSTYSYISHLQDAQIANVMEFYGILCETVHPAQDSISWLYGKPESGEGMQLRPENTKDILHKTIIEYGSVLEKVFGCAISSPLITLKMLHKFPGFPNIQVLKRLDFSQIGMYSKNRSKFGW